MKASPVELLTLKNANKCFPGIQALKNVGLSIRKGEVHALVGENGAGKSTLMHVLCGVLKPDSGEMALNGKRFSSNSPDEATRNGIGMVFQELSLFDGLSVAENIFPNRQPLKGGVFIDWEKLFADTEQLLSWCGFPLDAEKRSGSLSSSLRQLVEIAKAVSTNPLLLIMDEPTSSLGAEYIDLVFGLIRKFKNEGKSVIYISHNLDEIFAVADRVTVLRDGEVIGMRNIEDTNERELVSMMAGAELSATLGGRRSSARRIEGGLRIDNLSREPYFRNISCSFRRGEITGLAGLVGAGRSELGRTIFGASRPQGGSISLDGRPLSINSPCDSIGHGIVYISDDRKCDGLYLRKSVSDNLIANKLSRYASGLGMLAEKEIRRDIPDFISAGNILCRGPEEEAQNLSGGNQQKLMLEAWLSLNPAVIIADEPARGVDVHSKAHIYRSLRELASAGTAVAVISPDFKELLHFCDRILIFRKGGIMGEFPAAEISGETILAFASGLPAQ